MAASTAAAAAAAVSIVATDSGGSCFTGEDAAEKQSVESTARCLVSTGALARRERCADLTSAPAPEEGPGCGGGSSWGGK